MRRRQGAHQVCSQSGSFTVVGGVWRVERVVGQDSAQISQVVSGGSSRLILVRVGVGGAE